MRRQLVHGEAAALRDRANRFEKVLAGARSRLHVHHHVGGHNLPDAPLDGVAGGMHLFEAGGARHADGHVHKVALAGAPHAHALGVQHAFGPSTARGMRSLQPRAERHRAAHPPSACPSATDPDDHARHASAASGSVMREPRRCRTCSPSQRRVMPTSRRTCSKHPSKNAARRPPAPRSDTCLRRAGQRARAEEVNSHRKAPESRCRQARPDLAVAETAAAETLPR